MGLDRLAALKLGYAPAGLGFRFNAVELIARLRPTEPALHDALDRWLEAVQARGAETLDSVLTVERLMRDAGLEPAGQPQSYADYSRWALAVHDRVKAAIGGDALASSAFLLGLTLGDLMTTLGLQVLVAALLAADGGHPLLRAQATALAETERRACADLRLLAPAGEIIAVVDALEAPGADRRALLERLESERLELERSLA